MTLFVSRVQTLEGRQIDFHQTLGNLRDFNEDDRAAVGGMVSMVRGREDLNSCQKEYLLSHQVTATVPKTSRK